MKPSEVIDGALGVLADESDWCQGDLYRYTSADNKEQFCLVGALQHITVGEGYQGAICAVGRVVTEQYRTKGIGNWNDSHTFPEVRAVLEKAKANLEEAGQ